MLNAKRFFDAYGRAFDAKDKVRVLEIGSQDVNGSIRGTAPARFEYVGVDFEKAKGVDIVLDDPYALPFEDASFDIVLSSSCFEHSEMFWLVFLEILRVLRPSGLFYLNAPSNGAFHRYPVDCWRFFPDSGQALVTWGKRSGYNPILLESYTSNQLKDIWNDFVAVFLKDGANRDQYPSRILDTFADYRNGFVNGQETILNMSQFTEDLNRIRDR